MHVNLVSLLALLLSPAAQPSRPLRAGIDVDRPQQVKMVEPDYPETARVNWIQGVVLLEVVVDEDGRVANVETMRSIPVLDEAAIEAVRQWEYEPTVVDGEHKSVEMTIPLTFTLPGAEEWLVWPEGDPKLQIEAYSLVVLDKGDRRYLGTVKNTSKQALSGLVAGVSYVESLPVPKDDPTAGIHPPKRTNDVLPRYPRDARRSRIQGVVIVELRVDAAGKVDQTRVLRSIPPLDPAVLEAVHQWEYEPAHRDGVSIPVVLRVEVGFWEDKVDLSETLLPESTRQATETVELGTLEPGDSHDFIVEVRASPGLELQDALLNFLVPVEEGMRAVPARRQRKTLPIAR